MSANCDYFYILHSSCTVKPVAVGVARKIDYRKPLGPFWGICSFRRWHGCEAHRRWEGEVWRHEMAVARLWELVAVQPEPWGVCCRVAYLRSHQCAPDWQHRIWPGRTPALSVPRNHDDTEPA